MVINYKGGGGWLQNGRGKAREVLPLQKRGAEGTISFELVFARELEVLAILKEGEGRFPSFKNLDISKYIDLISSAHNLKFCNCHYCFSFKVIVMYRAEPSIIVPKYTKYNKPSPRILLLPIYVSYSSHHIRMATIPVATISKVHCIDNIMAYASRLPIII